MSDVLPSTPAAEAVVRIEGLWSVFGKGSEAFAVHQDLDLTVRQGEMLALVGGSGTGKTVLLRQMLGLLHPARGSVTVLGRPADEMGGEGAASRVGMLFQHGALYSAFNVLDNIAFALKELGTLPADLVRDAAMVKLQMVGLKPEHATRMPADLSGGMIKRVALARALIMDPPLLLLDEPTAGLDPNGADEFCALVRELHAALGVTMITVRPSAACSSRSSSQNSSALFGSSPAVGSSSSSSGGSMMSARARATRLIMPPERSAGMRVACSGLSPARRSLTMAASLTSAGGSVPSSRSAKAMLSSTLKAENSAPCWNSMPTRLLARSPPTSSAAGRPSTSTLPRVGRVSPRMWRSNTVLPVPEPPTSERISPRCTVSCRSSCTVNASSPRPNTVARPRMSTTGGSTTARVSASAAGRVASMARNPRS